MPDLSVKRTTVLGQRRGIEGDGFLNAPQVYVSGVVRLSYRAHHPIVRAGVCRALGDTAEVGGERERGRR